MDTMSTDEKPRAVVASIGGETLRFELMREEVLTFEVLAGKPAITAMRDFAAGAWLVKDMHLLLRIAHPAGYHASRDDVRRMLADHGPANFTPLATRILEGALFGLQADEAAWSLETMLITEGAR